MEQRMRVRLKSHSLVKRVHDKRIVIVIADLVSYDPAVIKIQDGAQVSRSMRMELESEQDNSGAKPALQPGYRNANGITRYQITYTNSFRISIPLSNAYHAQGFTY